MTLLVCEWATTGLHCMIFSQWAGCQMDALVDPFTSSLKLGSWLGMDK